MHKIFYEKENEKYIDRIGAYLIPIKDNKIAVIKTPKGYFLLGGGLDNNESDIDCIKRECLEEIGYNVKNIKQICSAEAYCINSKIGYFHPIQRYYLGEIIEKIQEPIELDHKLMWVNYKDLIGNMFSDMQSWAIQQAVENDVVVNKNYLGKIIDVTIDRPIGSSHPKHKNINYPINYGYYKEVIASDGEEQDVYVMGVYEPISSFTGKIIAIIHRLNDVEDKWVVAPEEFTFTKEDIVEVTKFQEQYFEIEVIL